MTASTDGATFVDILRGRATRQADRRAYTFLLDGETAEAHLTYGELDARARGIAVLLRASHTPGDRALVLYPPSLDYITAFLGCLYAGIVAVPAYPPRVGRSNPRIKTILEDAQPAIVLAPDLIRAHAPAIVEQIPELAPMQWIAPDADVRPGMDDQWCHPGHEPSDLAFLQYTSGSTADPKGVMVRHGNLLANVAATHHALRCSPATIFVSWLPPYHDMGLVGGLLLPLYGGFPDVLMSPLSFLRRPGRWLNAISRYRATMSAAPSSAYQLCVREIGSEERTQLDLSSWDCAINGAEPVHPAVLERFARSFGPCGFRSAAFYPCYGLAEATLFVSGERTDKEPTKWSVGAEQLLAGRAQDARPGEATRLLVGCGRVASGASVVIVDPETYVSCKPGYVGEIWLSGESVAAGYWRNEEATTRTFSARLASGEGPFLRTGDLGILRGGELFVTGRLSDLIILRGHNHYPQDIEATVEACHPALSGGRGAAFSIEVDDEERLVVVHEVADPAFDAASGSDELIVALLQAVADEHELQAHAVVLVENRSIPKTTSGKIQRRECRQRFLEGNLRVLREWHAPLVRTRADADAPAGGLQAAVSSAAEDATPSTSAHVIETWLRSEIGTRLGLDPAMIDVRLPFTYYGLDSVHAVAIAADLGTSLGRAVPPTIVWDYPTIQAAARFLADDAEADLERGPSAAASGHDEPIAVVGMGCRLPGGVRGIEAFWELLREGRVGIVEVPSDRWDVEAYFDPDPEAPGKSYSRHGGFIEDVDRFDAAFFGISPREAAFMDPQQRLLLEVTWEALEHAAIAPDTLAATLTGAFVGISTSDYAFLHMRAGAGADMYVGTGNAHSIAANRLSYVLGLRGPSLAVDTACSSSLVAAHLACQSLRGRECDVALAGGVNLLLLPETTINLCKARMLASDGRCKAFDARADGYVRGEGCGVVVLKRLSDALACGDVVWAIIRGSAVNQDGRSNGLTAPNGPAQENVIQAALAMAATAPNAISYVEAHGTGTALGDPIELRALARALGADRQHPLIVGSVKTNFGHLEAAAGVASMIKAILAVHNGQIPPHLNFTHPTPHFPWATTSLRVPTDITPFPPGPRLAGVSSFGFGGTNAHLILEQPPEPAPTTAPHNGSETHPPVVVKISARGRPALRQAQVNLAEFVAGHGQVPLGAIAYVADVGRSDLPDRVAVVAGTHSELEDALRAAAFGRPHPRVAVGRESAGSARVAFLVPGQGSRVAGAAQALAREPAAARALDELAEVLGPLDCLPLAALLEPGEASERALAGTDVAQPALYALALSLAAWWQAAGVRPHVLLGHSAGAYAAAALAGVFSAQDGARLIAERGRLMATLPADGAMAAVGAEPENLRSHLATHPQLEIASHNAPHQTVISGPRGAMHELLEDLAAHGIRAEVLPVEHAFHSPHIDPMLDAFAAHLRGVAMQPPRLPLISDRTGQPAGSEIATADYWLDHARHTLHFTRALNAVAANVLIELGPATTLLALAQDTLGPDNHTSLSSLGGAHPRQALARAYTLGVPIDWRAVTSPPGYPCTLPTYPFQRRRHWMPGGASTSSGHGPEEERHKDAPPWGEAPDQATADVIAGERVSELIDELLRYPIRERRARLISHLQREVAHVIGVDPAELIEPRQGLFELGFDSLMAVELQKTLQRALNRELPVTLALDYPTVEGLADRLLEAVVDTERAPTRGAAHVSSDESVAIVGMACRFPGGANDLDAYWRLLRDGLDGIVTVPASRWDANALYDPDPSAPLRMNTRSGGFLDLPVDGFDADMWGISPREAISMDPQQRLLLEVGWEALENAGLVANELMGSPTGVFVGINTSDYLQLMAAGGIGDIDAYLATGNTFSVAAGRLSYLLGLRGPSLAIDTACSSSLVAAHLACRSLATHESSVAIVAGVNLMLSPSTSISMSKLRALSPDGHCKAFDAGADGYGRGEGCGVLVLKRLPDAVVAGDRIWAVIHGSAVNQDGRSAGLTVPNGPAQIDLIRDALAAARLQPGDVDYVEAHGTGTPMGDPIELQALAEALTAGRPGERPLMVGSVKTNIGHLEAAAGVAGLIKVALALHHDRIPPNLHFQEPTPYISWDKLPIKVPTELASWPKGVKRRTAGVSSFGFSGTNAHVLLQETPPPVSSAGDEKVLRAVERERSALLVISARSQGAVQALAASFQEFLSVQDIDTTHFEDICSTAAIRRTHHTHRVGVVARSCLEAADKLGAFARGEPTTGVVTGQTSAADSRRLIFVYCGGAGAEWSGMGRGLLDEEPVFREAVEGCDALIRAHAGWSPLDALAAADPSWLEDTTIALPLIFSVQVGLTALWHSWSVVADAVLGHSLGEIAAAHAAGVLTLDDAVKVVLERGRAIKPGRGQGRMATLGLPASEVEQLLTGYSSDVSIAAVNGPSNTVVAGDPCSIDALMAAAAKRKAFCRPFPGDYAFHSVQMEPFSQPLADALDGLAPSAPKLPIVSTVTGRHASDGDFGAAHWGRSIKEPVRFMDAIRAATGPGHNMIVEVGPHPVLATAITQCLAADGREGTAFASMHRGDLDPRATLLQTLGALHVLGHPVDHRSRYPGGGRFVDLPTYPWQRRRYWQASAGVDVTRPQPGGQRSKTAIGGYALLHRRFDAAGSGGERYFEADLDPAVAPYAGGIRLAGVPAMAACVPLELALEAARLAMPASFRILSDVAIYEPATPPGDGSMGSLQLIIRPEGDKGATFEVFARMGDGPSELVTAGRFGCNAGPRLAAERPAAVRARLSLSKESPLGVYGAMRDAGLVVDERLQALVGLWRGDGEALALLRLPDVGGGHVAHPALLEAATHVLGAAAPIAARRPLWPFAIAVLRVDRHLPDHVWAHARIVEGSSDGLYGDVLLSDETGRVSAEMRGLRLRPVSRGTLERARDRSLADLLYALEWQPRRRGDGLAPVESGQRPGTWILLADAGGVAVQLAGALEACGHRCVLVRAQVSVGQSGDGVPLIRPEDSEQIQRLVADADRDGAPPLRGAIYLWGLHDAPASEPSLEELELVVHAECAGLLHLVQALGQREGAELPRIWVATRAAQSVTADQDAIAPAHAPLWGLARVVALEHPELWGGLVDLDPSSTSDEAATLLAEILDSDDEDQIAYRNDERYAARLSRVQIHPSTEDLRLRSDVSYMITGGRGSVGLKVAAWLADRGARHLVLTGRRALPERSRWEALAGDEVEGAAIRAIRNLESRGVAVYVPVADATDHDQMAAILHDGESSWPPVRGVIHAAGLFRPQRTDDMSLKDLKEVLAPKLAGTWILHKLTRGRELDFLVLFSSAASVWGSALAAHYVAANHFMDVVAHYRHRLGLPALIVNWGWWDGSDMVGDAAQAYFSALGLDVIPEDLGFAALERLLLSGVAQCTVAPVDWRKFKPAFTAKRRRPLLDFIEAPPGPDETPAASGEGLRLLDEIQAAPSAARSELMVAFLQRQVGSILGRDPSERMDPELGFFEAGMDSITSVQLTAQLESGLGIVLPATVAFEHPTIVDFARYLLDEALHLSDAPDEPPAIERAVTNEERPRSEAASYEGLSEAELLALLAGELGTGAER